MNKSLFGIVIITQNSDKPDIMNIKDVLEYTPGQIANKVIAKNDSGMVILNDDIMNLINK